MSSMTKLLIILSFVLFSSCSLFRRNGASPVDDNEKPSTSPRDQMVSKALYEQLLSKYEVLQKRLEAQTLTKDKESDSQSEDTIVNKIKESDQNLNTVDAFKPQSSALNTNVAAPQIYQTPELDTNEPDDKIEAQIEKFRMALKLYNEHKFNEALKPMQDLSQSKNLQIKVRANFYLGEMFFQQNEFDLAMQMYESIVLQYSFTGLTIASLEKLIICAEKLKQKDKLEKYKGIYHHTFGLS